MLKIIIQYETTSVTLNSRSMTDNESRSLKFMNWPSYKYYRNYVFRFFSSGHLHSVPRWRRAWRLKILCIEGHSPTIQYSDLPLLMSALKNINRWRVQWHRAIQKQTDGRAGRRKKNEEQRCRLLNCCVASWWFSHRISRTCVCWPSGSKQTMFNHPWRHTVTTTKNVY